tara:strand:- start:19 stop:1089 length:1071 start_codon:yes stop_codon:yes gene_type:complete
MAFTTIDDPSVYFQTQLYTGNGSADHAITNGGNSDLQPDWVWIKNRDATDAHLGFDTNRGVTKMITMSDYVIEATDADTLDAFQSDGFRVDADVKVNTNTEKYVAWQWKCNAGTTETAVTESGNNPGNTRQTNADAGFSIISYVGTGGAGTIAHGLGVAPEWFIVKATDNATNWMCYHEANTADPETDALVWDETGATSDNSVWWNDTAPTSSVFTVGTHDRVNADGKNFIAYVFAPKQGYSKFGGYTGNGNNDGPFIYTGFKPAMFIRKRTNGANGWNIWDNKRAPFNEMHASLASHTTDVEDANTGYNDVDFFSNGIKIHDTGDSHNLDGATYIYIAFAENPFVSSTGIPTTAR